MQFCERHWTMMRAAIDDRGMTGLVAKNGVVAMKQMVGELQGEEKTHTFDPLMSMHWAIATNVMEFLGACGLNPLYLMGHGPEDPMENCGEHFEGKTWPRCPLCYINIAHEVTCPGEGCKIARIDGYDWMIDRAAQDALEQARGLGLMPEAS